MAHGITAARLAGAGMVLAAVVAGCSSQPGATSGSAYSCYQFAVRAIQQRVTVTTTPAACQGLSPLEVNVAVSRAVRAEAAGVHGLPERRKIIDSDIRYVAGMERAVPSPTATGQAPPGQAPPGQAPPGQASPSRAALSLAALVAWLSTASLGLSMMARWITRIRWRDVEHGLVRWPVRNFVHSGAALAGLLVWISYLAAGLTAVAWVACGLLLVVASFGMILVFPVDAAGPDGPPENPPPAGLPGAGLPGAGLPGAGRTGAGHPPGLVVAAHIIAASVTILLTVLAAIGPG
jgi:hypothetical protein